MKSFQLGDSQSVLKTIEEIVELFAENNYEKAFDLFNEHQYFRYTPEKFKETIETYFDDEPRKKVTSAYSAAGLHPNKRRSLESEDDDFVSAVHSKFPYCVCWYKEGDGYKGNYAHADLPLNGSWSDLTVKFEFDDDGNVCWLVLEDVEVM